MLDFERENMAKAEYRSAIRSRELITSALIDLLQKKPIDKITVTDVVEKAQINRGTFYAHYVSIEDVLEHMISQRFMPIQEALSQQSHQLSNVIEILLHQIQKIIENEIVLFQKITQSNAFPYLYHKFVIFVEEYMLQHEADYSFGNHDDYVFMIRFCAGGLSNLYYDWCTGKQEISLAELTTKATNMLNSIISV